MEFPSAFLAFYGDFDFSMACSFCSDFDLDVLELYINGVYFLAFFRNRRIYSMPGFFAKYRVLKLISMFASFKEVNLVCIIIFFLETTICFKNIVKICIVMTVRCNNARFNDMQKWSIHV